MKLVVAVLGCFPSVVVTNAIKSEMLGHPLTEANLVHLEEELENAVGKSGGVTQSPLFSELSKMINDTMAPGILTAHTGAQSQLDGFRTAFEVCVAPDVSPSSSGGATTSKGISDKLEEHRQCRNNEGVAASGADECNGNLAKQEIVLKSACKSVPGSDGSPPPLDKEGHVGCKVTPGDYEGWLNSFSHQINQLKTQYDEAAGGCGNASKLVDDAKPKCLAANSSMAANKTSCDGIQAAADQMGCSNDPTAHAACDTYKTCWETANQTYLDANESIAAAQVNRTMQWRVLKRMQCLLSEEAQGATHDGIDACREATIDTSHLDLVYPVVPAKVDCSVPAGGPRPCTAEWIQAYGQMPPNAPAAPCTPCPVQPFSCFAAVGADFGWISGSATRGSTEQTGGFEYVAKALGGLFVAGKNQDGVFKMVSFDAEGVDQEDGRWHDANGHQVPASAAQMLGWYAGGQHVKSGYRFNKGSAFTTDLKAALVNFAAVDAGFGSISGSMSGCPAGQTCPFEYIAKVSESLFVAGGFFDRDFKMALFDAEGVGQSNSGKYYDTYTGPTSQAQMVSWYDSVGSYIWAYHFNKGSTFNLKAPSPDFAVVGAGFGWISSSTIASLKENTEETGGFEYVAKAQGGLFVAGVNLLGEFLMVSIDGEGVDQQMGKYKMTGSGPFHPTSAAEMLGWYAGGGVVDHSYGGGGAYLFNKGSAFTANLKGQQDAGFAGNGNGILLDLGLC